MQRGGFVNMKGTSTVQAFDLNTGRWINSIAPLEVPRVFACATVFNDSIYVMGGTDSLGNVLNSVEVYDPGSNRWHFAPSMNIARKGAAAVAFGNNILVFDGADSMNDLLYDVEAFSPDKGTWRVLDQHTVFPRAFQNVAKIGNSIYIYGGLGATVGPVQFIERYVPSQGVVQLQFRWSGARAFFSSIVRNDSIFVISGWGKSGTENGYFDDVEMLDMANPMAPVEREANVSLDQPRRGFVAAEGRNGQVYLFGGLSSEFGQVPVASVGTLYQVTAVSEQSNNVPTSFKLSQNYPNPFNPTTTIEFVVPPPGAKVSLDIYNMLGQKVRTLVSDYLNAGQHSVSFDGANMASGTYIYLLQTPKGIIHRKMVLIK